MSKWGESDIDVKRPAGGRLAGRVALITGGTSGIGRATALLFAREEATVIITGRRAVLGQALVQTIEAAGGRAGFIQADHRRSEDCQGVVARIVEELGHLDILFNNAGIVTSGTAESTSEAVWQETLDLNVTAVWRMCRLVLPHMRAQGGGVIINNASDWGLVGGANAVAYCASKGAVVLMTKAMALDHARDNIRINAVCPGDTFVERWRQAGYAGVAGAVEDSMFDQAGEDLPIGRLGRTEEIARAVLFLASDDSSFMTGVALPVDGGNTAR